MTRTIYITVLYHCTFKLKTARKWAPSLGYLIYKPFDFRTTDCTPETRGRRVVFFSSLDFMHLILLLYAYYRCKFYIDQFI